jgi:hypothetical protein
MPREKRTRNHEDYDEDDAAFSSSSKTGAMPFAGAFSGGFGGGGAPAAKTASAPSFSFGAPPPAASASAPPVAAASAKHRFLEGLASLNAGLRDWVRDAAEHRLASPWDAACEAYLVKLRQLRAEFPEPREQPSAASEGAAAGGGASAGGGSSFSFGAAPPGSELQRASSSYVRGRA